MSSLVTPQVEAQLSLWLPNPGVNMVYRFTPLYRADTCAGFNAATFHTLCNNKGPTVSIARTNTG
jgi:hypothetical protein